jgi:lipid II:glycine glycyltransferase (peptidoglycan interpeptide bridge formation enzyme)
MDGRVLVVGWRLLSSQEDIKSWDNNLKRFEDYNYCQTIAWGDYRSFFGWRPYRWAAYTDKGEVKALMQGLIRNYPGGFGIMWVPGGPIGDIASWNQEMKNVILQSTGLKRLYCRFNPFRLYRPADTNILETQGWRRTSTPLLSGLSMLYEVDRDEESRLQSCSKNWRHNLRRSQKYDLSFNHWNSPDVDRMMAIYNEMETYKDIRQQYSREELEKIFELFGNRIIVYSCIDERGDLIAFRGCMVFGNKAWDLFAATTVKGRNLYASYQLFWKLIDHCKAKGVTAYDMGGIDPKKNEGVYHFKKGTGAQEIKYLGEWEWATSEIMRLGSNFAIRHRMSNV